IEPGMRVRVPLGRQVRTGVVAGFAEAPPPGELRSILDVLDTDPFLPPDLLELCRWTARYYLTTLAEVIGAIVPAAVPVPARERVVALARRLDPDAEAALARRAPARAAAYRALAARPDGVLTIAGARPADGGSVPRPPSDAHAGAAGGRRRDRRGARRRHPGVLPSPRGDGQR